MVGQPHGGQAGAADADATSAAAASSAERAMRPVSECDSGTSTQARRHTGGRHSTGTCPTGTATGTGTASGRGPPLPKITRESIFIDLLKT